MANEATLWLQTGYAIPFTVDDTIAVTKGSLMKLSGSMTAFSAATTDDKIAGIASSDKIANDGVTKLGVVREGYFVMKASGTITFGDPVGAITTYTNYVASQIGTQTLSGSRTLGTAMESCTNGQTLVVHVHPEQAWRAV